MRGTDKQQLGVFSYISVEDRVPRNHPLRGIRCIVDAALQDLDRVLGAMYAKTGRSSIAPEKLIRALLLQVFYSIRSERQLMEQLDYNLLFRWFVGMNLDDPVWDHSTFSKNRDRLIEVDIARRLMLAVVEQARGKNLVSEEHFSVDGTLIEAWASHKSFRPKNEEPPTGGGRNPEVDFHGERRINDTHASRTDPESRLYRKAKGKEAKLCYAGHALMENRNGFVVDSRASQATGTAETDAALAMVNAVPGEHAITVGGDKGFDTADFVSGLMAAKATPHIARNTRNRESAVPEAIAATEGYAVSQRFRKRIEEAFGWGKFIGPLGKAMVRGLKKVDWLFKMTMAAYNMVRLRNLTAI